MHQIDEYSFSQDFADAWSAAGKHLLSKSGGTITWLRNNLSPPIIEHLSFRMGNRLFFIYVDAAECNTNNKRKNFISHCNRASAFPCVISMEKSGNEWTPINYDWGLILADTNEPVNPIDLVDEEKIEISDWELQDFSLKRLAFEIENEGGEIIGMNSDPEVFPSCIFRKDEKTFFVILSAARHPIQIAAMPINTPNVLRHLSGRTDGGYFASIVVASTNDPFIPDSLYGYPLYRGEGYYIKYSGLIPFQLDS
jgi:hypothetical protein